MKYITANQQLNKPQLSDLREALSDQFVICTPERIGLQLVQRQHAYLFRRLKTVYQMVIVVERLSTSEVESCPAAFEFFQFLQILFSVLKWHDAILPRTAVFIAICTGSIAPVGQ